MFSPAQVQRQTIADSALRFWQNTRMFSSYAHVLSHLEGLGLFHMDLTLDRMQSALTRLDLQRPPYAVAQVVGTNGKGSTATLLAALSQAHGLRTGLYTSPHMVSPRERIRINGLMLPESKWPRLATAVHQAEARLTYFEFLTVLAVLAFAEAGVDMAVMEAGLGGRWDATTALAADLLCVTPISMDHEQVLGTNLTAIATDKAGAFRRHVAVIHAAQEAEALEVLRKTAQQCRAPLLAAADLVPLPQGQSLHLRGPHQRGNAQLALAAWRHLALQRAGQRAGQRAWPCQPEAENLALRTAFVPGRLQRITLPDGTDMLLDGAHNAHGLRALSEALRAEGIRPGGVIFSCLADKDLQHMLPLVRALAENVPLWVPTIAHNARAAQAADLAPRISEKAQPMPSLAEALAAAQAALRASSACDPACGPLLLCGSLYLLGEFFTLHPEFLETPPVCEVV